MRTLLAALILGVAVFATAQHVYTPPSGKPLSPAQQAAIKKIEDSDAKTRKVTPVDPNALELPAAKLAREEREAKERAQVAAFDYQNKQVTQANDPAKLFGLGAGMLVILAVSALFYFIPLFVAISNRHRNTAAIGILNFFLGWTLIGWVIALVWAVKRDPVAVPSR